MSVYVEKAPKDIMDRMTRAVTDFHPWLAEGHVRIKVLMLSEEDPAKRPIKRMGHACVAEIKVCNEKHRVLMGCEAYISVDAEVYDEMLPESQRALFDHELRHLVHVTDSKGRPRFLADGRAKVASVPDDFMVTGFYDVIERHKGRAVEAQALAGVLGHELEGQLLFDFVGFRKPKV